jgi:hypothetical protein
MNELVKQDTELDVMNEYKKVAAELVKSSLIPKHFKAPQDAWYAILYGREMGLSPIYSLNNVAVINGKPSLSADAMLAIVKRSPEYGGITVDSSDEGCKVELKRIYKNGVTDTTIAEFTLNDAKKAGLYDSPGAMYKKYPRRMCRARAVAFACRDAFGDILAGNYTPEELNGGKDPEVEFVAVEVVESMSKESIAIEQPKPAPIELAKALKAANDLLQEVQLTSSMRNEYAEKAKVAHKNGNIGELEDIIADLQARKEKAEQAAIAARKPMPPIEPEPPIEEAEFVPVDDGLDKARAGIEKALKTLAKEKIDRFQEQSRVIESMKKHLNAESLAECTDVSLLNTWLEHLRDKYRQAKNKPEESPESKARNLVAAMPNGERKEQAEACLAEAELNGEWNFIIDTFGGDQ